MPPPLPMIAQITGECRCTLGRSNAGTHGENLGVNAAMVVFGVHGAAVSPARQREKGTPPAAVATINPAVPDGRRLGSGKIFAVLFHSLDRLRTFLRSARPARLIPSACVSSCEPTRRPYLEAAGQFRQLHTSRGEQRRSRHGLRSAVGPHREGGRVHQQHSRASTEFSPRRGNASSSRPTST